MQRNNKHKVCYEKNGKASNEMDVNVINHNSIEVIEDLSKGTSVVSKEPVLMLGKYMFSELAFENTALNRVLQRVSAEEELLVAPENSGANVDHTHCPHYYVPSDATERENGGWTDVLM